MRNDLLDRLAWRIHHDAFDKARKQGAGFHAATLAGFAATDTPPASPAPCRCERAKKRAA